MDLDKIITTLCSIVCMVVTVLTYRDSRKKQLGTKPRGTAHPLRFPKSIIQYEKEKSKGFIINGSVCRTSGFMAGDGGKGAVAPAGGGNGFGCGGIFTEIGKKEKALGKTGAFLYKKSKERRENTWER